VKAQRQTDTETSRERASRIVDRNLSAINVFHRDAPKSFSQLRKRRLNLNRSGKLVYFEKSVKPGIAAGLLQYLKRVSGHEWQISMVRLLLDK
jgi:hypothetical protein